MNRDNIMIGHYIFRPNIIGSCIALFHPVLTYIGKSANIINIALATNKSLSHASKRESKL
jgi:hypothetical protein